MINRSLSRRLGLLHHANTGGKHTFILSTPPLVSLFFFFFGSTIVFPPQVAPRLWRTVACHRFASQRFIGIPVDLHLPRRRSRGCAPSLGQVPNKVASG